jgi:hypothetical protein
VTRLSRVNLTGESSLASAARASGDEGRSDVLARSVSLLLNVRRNLFTEGATARQRTPTPPSAHVSFDDARDSTRARAVTAQDVDADGIEQDVAAKRMCSVAAIDSADGAVRARQQAPGSDSPMRWGEGQCVSPRPRVEVAPRRRHPLVTRI